MKSRICQLLICLLSLSVSLHAAPPKEAVSVLDAVPGIRAQFEGDSQYHRLIFEETFQDNGNKWPLQRESWEGKKKPNTLKDGRYTVNMGDTHDGGRAGWIMPASRLIPDGQGITASRHATLIEACFKLTRENGDGFGLGWDLSQGMPGKYNGSYFVIRADGHYSYHHWLQRQQGTVPWVKSDAIRRGSRVNTLSILSQGRRETLFFINGQLVFKQPYRGSHYNATHGFRRIQAPKRGKDFTAEIVWFSARSAALTREPAMTAARVIQAAADDKEGFMVPVENAFLDTRTNRIWYRHANSAMSKSLPQTSLGQAEEWVAWMNSVRRSGFEDWRLPVTWEYQSLYRAGEGGNSGTIFYHPGLKEKSSSCWTSEQKDRKAVLFDFKTGRTQAVSLDSPQSIWPSALAVRTGPFDLAGRLGPWQEGRLPDDQEMMLDRVAVAMAAGLNDAGAALFEALVSQAGSRMYALGYTRKLESRGLPLSLASRLLLAVRDREKTSPLFWVEAGRLAGLAGQPAMVLQASKKLASLPMDPGLKEICLDQAALLEAHGLALMNQGEKALVPLLMRMNLKANPYILPYINANARGLLKDKTALARLFGAGPEIFPVPFEVPGPQSFHHLETGQLLPGGDKVPEMERGSSQNHPAPLSPGTGKKTGKTGATVLD